MNTHVPPAECGFVRVPRNYLDLPVSPGAKVLLLHLCAAANECGESWYGYGDIASLLGRSKSSIVGYVRELVDLGLVEAIEQKTANGFNYRRRLRLTQWQSFLAFWKKLTAGKKINHDKEMKPATEAGRAESSVTPTRSGHPESTADIKSPRTSRQEATPERRDFSGSQVEHGVQPAERKDPSGPINNIHQNKTPAASASVVWSDEDEKAWKKFRPSDNDPISTVIGSPCPTLVDKLRQIEGDLLARSDILPPEEALNSARERINGFAEQHHLTRDKKALEEAAVALSRLAETHRAQEASITALHELWQPYWRKLPSSRQIESSLSDVARKASPDRDVKIRISRIRQRIWVAGMHIVGGLRRSA